MPDFTAEILDGWHFFVQKRTEMRLVRPATSCKFACL